MKGEDVTVRGVLGEGEVVKIEFGKEDVSERVLGEGVGIDIVYEDEDVLVVNKEWYVSSTG